MVFGGPSELAPVGPSKMLDAKKVVAKKVSVRTTLKPGNKTLPA
jgi:hypothetical protein